MGEKRREFQIILKNIDHKYRSLKWIDIMDTFPIIAIKINLIA